MADSASALDAATAAAAPPSPAGATPPSVILLIEDDKHIQRSVSYQLHRQGYKVVCQDDGESGLHEALQHRFDVVVVDVMLPKLDGLSVCKQLRGQRPQQPIILVSARGSELDKITGLEFGADDYLAKPFSPAELEARIRALRRRVGIAAAAAAPALVCVGNLVLDADRYQLRAGDAVVRLTPKELKLLRLMMTAPGRIFTRENLLAQIWGCTYDGYQRAVDAHINRLKSKLQKQLGQPATWLESVYGVGYRVRDPGPE
ncbi:MAG: response regulator transcription factor [Terriglobales bacterium]